MPRPACSTSWCIRRTAKSTTGTPSSKASGNSRRVGEPTRSRRAEKRSAFRRQRAGQDGGLRFAYPPCPCSLLPQQAGTLSALLESAEPEPGKRGHIGSTGWPREQTIIHSQRPRGPNELGLLDLRHYHVDQRAGERWLLDRGSFRALSRRRL